MAKTVSKFWAIHGPFGFYTGTYLTRRAAIRDHVICLMGPVDIPRGWRELKRNGDRAVKVLVRKRGRRWQA